MENYGVTDCMTLERGGVTYGLFGLMGVDSDECAPTSGFTRTDAAKAAKRCVETLKGEGAEIIVCPTAAPGIRWRPPRMRSWPRLWTALT